MKSKYLLSFVILVFYNFEYHDIHIDLMIYYDILFLNIKNQ